MNNRSFMDLESDIFGAVFRQKISTYTAINEISTDKEPTLFFMCLFFLMKINRIIF